MKEKITKVAIIRTSKLTLTEINALTSKILQDSNKLIEEYNQKIISDVKFKSEVKKIKTKTGVLSAERALTFIKGRHKKVEIKVISNDYDKQYKELLDSSKKRKLNEWTDSNDFKSIKNELILSQVNNKNMIELAENITLKLIN